MGTAEIIEQTVINTLKENITATVKPYPDNPNNYQPNVYPCEVLVKYVSTTFDSEDITSSAHVAQRILEITVAGQSLRSKGGIYDTLSDVISTLQGVNAGGMGVLQIVSEQFTDENNGVWKYTQKWTFKQNVMYDRQDRYYGYDG